MAGEMECQADRDRVRELARPGERLLRGPQTSLGITQHPLHQGKVVQDVHPIVHAGHEHVRPVVTGIVEAERGLERRLGGNEIASLEAGDAGHEVADRQSN